MVRHSPGAGLTGGDEVNPGSGWEGIERSAWRAMAPMRVSRCRWHRNSVGVWGFVIATLSIISGRSPRSRYRHRIHFGHVRFRPGAELQH